MPLKTNTIENYYNSNLNNNKIPTDNPIYISSLCRITIMLKPNLVPNQIQ